MADTIALTRTTSQMRNLKYMQSTRTKSTTDKVSFADKMYALSSQVTRKQNVQTSVVDDFIKRHPDDKYQVERMVNAGNNVLSQYGRDSVDAMSMDEYKEYIYDILDKIPFDSSQQRDTQYIDITEDGWEQMKNDPKYEAWVVGYFKVDRAVKNPFGCQFSHSRQGNGSVNHSIDFCYDGSG